MNDQPIRLKKFGFSIQLSEEVAGRLQESLPLLEREWLEFKRELARWEMERIYGKLETDR